MLSVFAKMDEQGFRNEILAIELPCRVFPKQYMTGNTILQLANLLCCDLQPK